MNGPGLGVRLMFWQSTAMRLRRRGTAGGAMAFVIYVFLVMVSIAMAQAQDSAPAESSSAHPETPLPSSVQQGSVDQKVTNPCSLLAPDNNSQSPATGKEADMTIGTFAYAPLSAHCKFHLFLKSTYFAIHVRVSRFSGHLGPRNGTVAPLRRRCAGLGEAIWRDFGKYRIAEIHPDFCPLDDPASGSSLFSFAQENVYFPRVLCRDQSGGHQERQRR